MYIVKFDSATKRFYYEEPVDLLASALTSGDGSVEITDTGTALDLNIHIVNQSEDINDVNNYPCGAYHERVLPSTGSLINSQKYLLTWYIKFLPGVPYNADFGDNVMEYYNPDTSAWVEVDDWDTGALYNTFVNCIGSNPCINFEQGFNTWFKGARIVKPSLEGTDYKIKLRFMVHNGYGNFHYSIFHYDLIKINE